MRLSNEQSERWPLDLAMGKWLMILTKGRFSGLRAMKPDWSGFKRGRQECGDKREQQCLGNFVKTDVR